MDLYSGPNQLDIMAKLQSTMSSLRILHQKSTEQQTDNSAIEEIAFAKINQKNTIDIQSLKQELIDKNNYIKQLEDQLKDDGKNFIANLKNELFRLENNLSEKQAQNESLSKLILRQKQKINQLEVQLQNQREEKQSYQNNFNKLFDTIKAELNQIKAKQNIIYNSNFLSKHVFKQFTERIEVMSATGLQNNLKMSLLQSKYERMKKDFHRLSEKNNHLEIEKEKLKQRLWRFENNVNETIKDSKNKLLQENSGGILSKISKCSMKSKNEENIRQNSIVQEKNKNKPSKYKNFNLSSTLLLQKLDETLSLCTEYKTEMGQVHSAINQLNAKITQDQETWSEVLTVKETNKKLKDELNQLKQANLNQILADQLLKAQNPTLFEYFKEKMSQFEEFENRLQNLQRQSVRVMDLIERIMFEGITTINKPLEPSSNQKQQNENQLKSKLKKQLQEKFDLQKQIVKKEIENRFISKQNALNQEIKRLNKEVDRLMIKNEDMYNLITELEEQQQAILQEEEQKRQQQQLMQPSNKKSIQETETQMSIKASSTKQKIDKQLLAYLQKKTQDIEKELNEKVILCQKYKKELKLLFENYKPKSTKLKIPRCMECFLSIVSESKKCQKCKLELHLQICYKDHESNCKKKSGVKQNGMSSNNTKKNPNQRKRTSNQQLVSSRISQNMDYFE